MNRLFYLANTSLTDRTYNFESLSITNKSFSNNDKFMFLIILNY